jgi:hypothetical protein
VAYLLRRAGAEQNELWVTTIADGSSELVARGATNHCWSPDSRELLYGRAGTTPDGTETDAQAAPGRLVIRDSGGSERIVGAWSTPRYFFYPTHWYSDNGVLGSYQEPAVTGPAALVLWPATSTDAHKPERVLLVRPGVHFWQGMFSPNRKWISFLVERLDRPGLEMAVAPASAPERWVRVAADHPFPDKPRWAADGRTLYFLSLGSNAYFNLWAVRFDAGAGVPVGTPYVLSAFDSPRMAISRHITRTEMDVSAGQAILTMQSVTGSIWMLDNVDK